MSSITNEQIISGGISATCLGHVDTKNLVSIDGIDNQAYKCNECAKKLIINMLKTMPSSELEGKKIRIISQSNENGAISEGNLFVRCPVTFQLLVNGFVSSNILEK